MMNSARRVTPPAWLATLVLLAGLATSVDTRAQEAMEQAAGDQGVTLNLQDADIRALINTVSELTGRNFVVDPRVKGKVTVISAEATDRDDLYDIFLSILRVHGYAAVPSGDVIKIVPDATAKQQGGAVSAPNAARRPLDELVTAVIPLAHADAAGLVPILRPLLPQEAHLAAYAEGNVLVAADTSGNVRRIIDLVRRVDRPSADSDIEVVTLDNAAAKEIVETLTQLARVGANGSPKQTLPFVADARTNSILLAGSEADRIRYRALISRLDAPVDEDAGIEVVYLRFASAGDLAPVVQNLFDPAAGGKAARTAAAGPSVQPEENTNALIVQGSPSEIRRVRAVIEQLDVRRAQVLVEGVIAEVSTNAADELGIQWSTNTPADGVFAGSSLPGTTSGAFPNPFGETTGLASLGTGLTLGYFSNGDLRSLVRALSTDAYTNVLSTPSLVTLDNAEAEILVGQNVPFITGQFTNNATTPDNPFQTIERQDVGIILRVRPQINEGDTVTLEIEQEVSSIDRDDSGSDLITNERRISTTVLVDDTQTIVLGGLITDELRENEQKVPIVGDIPVIGLLFRNSRDDVTKQNLMVFLRPTILKDPDRAAEVSDRRYDSIRDKQARQEARQRALYPRNTGPLLDTFDGLLD